MTVSLYETPVLYDAAQMKGQTDNGLRKRITEITRTVEGQD